MYESDGLAVGLTLSVVIGAGIISICFLLSLIVYKPPKEGMFSSDSASMADMKENEFVKYGDQTYKSAYYNNVTFDENFVLQNGKETL